MNNSQERKIIMNSYLNIMDFLTQAYGKNCEIVLHSVEDNKTSIIAIKNGEISGRKVGDELSLVGIKVKEIYENEGYSVNMQEKSYAGKDIKSSSYYIKDSTGVLIGILCINFDLTAAQNAKKFLDELTGITKISASNKTKFASDSIKDFTIKVIEEVIKDADIPADRLTAEEKIKILRVLKEKEVFRTKGATRVVAKHLNSSETSIYRYLKELE
ncbi:MAG: PAS domain-containing protein [Clostridiaceae bacterium]|nr:PAS domain-containing protein [Clostridiaceae bacterium]